MAAVVVPTSRKEAKRRAAGYWIIATFHVRFLILVCLSATNPQLCKLRAHGPRIEAHTEQLRVYCVIGDLSRASSELVIGAASRFLAWSPW